MLNTITLEHFRQIQGTTCVLQLDDGSALPVTIDDVREKPLARMSDTSRMPFTVTMTSLAPSEFIDGQCTIELPDAGHVPGIFVSRVPALGRDESLAYYHISFN